jgi:hypothetical protein
VALAHLLCITATVRRGRHCALQPSLHGVSQYVFGIVTSTAQHTRNARNNQAHVVSALASGTQVRGFKPGRSRRIFRAKKFAFRQSHIAALQHVKDAYNYRGSSNCKLNSLGHLSPIILPCFARGLSRHLCVERAWRR